MQNIMHGSFIFQEPWDAICKQQIYYRCNERMEIFENDRLRTESKNITKNPLKTSFES